MARASVPRAGSLSSYFGLGPLPLHTDTAHWNVPCRYLALACVLKAGLDGIRRKLVPGDPVEVSVAALSDDERAAMGIEQLPLSLHEAVSALDEDAVIRAALGDHSYHRLREAKLAEWETYRTQVHPWELEAYLSL